MAPLKIIMNAQNSENLLLFSILNIFWEKSFFGKNLFGKLRSRDQNFKMTTLYSESTGFETVTVEAFGNREN